MDIDGGNVKPVTDVGFCLKTPVVAGWTVDTL